MSTKQEVEAFVAAFADHWSDESGGFAKLMHKDATLRTAGAGEPLPYDEAARFVAGVKQAIPDLSLRVLSWAERNNMVFTEWEMTGTIGGKKVAWQGINRNHLKGAKSVDAVSCWDRHSLMEQVDADLAPLDLGQALTRAQTRE